MRHCVQMKVIPINFHQKIKYCTQYKTTRAHDIIQCILTNERNLMLSIILLKYNSQNFLAIVRPEANDEMQQI